MEKNSKIYIAGHNGLLGSAIKRTLEKEGYSNLLYRSSSELDLRYQSETFKFFDKEKPDYVFFAAAKVGGVKVNDALRADFIYDNIQIQNNIIHAAWKNKVEKLLFIGSNCIYPQMAPQPLNEDSLLEGHVEPTNEAYAIAKISGIKMCQAFNYQYGTNFVTIIPASLFGPGDNFDLESSHVTPALIRKFHEAKISENPHLTLWGTGNSRREIMYVDDAADACIFIMKNYNNSEIINAGIKVDYTIKEIAQMVKEVVGYEGSFSFEGKKKSGIKQKLLDSSKISKIGWRPKHSIREGLEKTYEWFKRQPLPQIL